MTEPLGGLRVALLEAHLTEEAAAHVRRFGGTPYSVPAVCETPRPDRVGPFIDRLCTGRMSAVIFVTGVGVTVLLREASRLGRLEDTLAALRETTIACRGPKPMAVLRQHNVPVHVAAAEPYTTKELVAALAAIDLEGKAVVLVRYGEPNRALADALLARGARLEELPLYEWVLPDDLEPLKTLVRELIDGRVDAIAFTNRIQGRHLFRVAAELGLFAQLADALNGRVLVAAVGPVCAEALRSVGVTPNVIPARAKMDEMIAALAEYVELTEGLSD